MDCQQEFIEAVKKGNLHLVKQILERDPALVHARAADGSSATVVATYHGHDELATHLIKAGAEQTIFEAAMTGSTPRLRVLVAEQPTLVNAYAPDGFFPLALAAYFGHTDAAQFLLSNGADVNMAARNGQRVTALHAATAGQHLEIAQALVAHGADVNCIQEGGYTPLHAAAQNGQIAMIALLLGHGADREKCLDDGRTAFDLAVGAGHAQVADMVAIGRT